MAPKASGLHSGGELVRGAFRNAPDEIRNVILMLEVAGLSFVLEEPVKILEQDILEFYRFAKVKNQGRKIRSFIRSTKFIITAAGINKVLGLPLVESEEISDEDIQRAKRYCGIFDPSSKIRRKLMNDAGKLLCDIIGKVLLSKVGSHDYFSEEAFKIHTAVICRKQFNFGEVLFERIKESFQAPNFGRILSLLLITSNPEFFKIAKGTPLHHTKKINMSLFSKWTRVIPKGGMRSVEEEEDLEIGADVAGQSSRGRIPSPLPASEPFHTEGEQLTPRVAEGEVPEGSSQLDLLVSRLVVEIPAAGEKGKSAAVDESRSSPVSGEPEIDDFLDDDAELDVVDEDENAGDAAEVQVLEIQSEKIAAAAAVVLEKSVAAEGEPATVELSVPVPPAPPVLFLHAPVPAQKKVSRVLEEAAPSTSFVAPEDVSTAESSQSSLLISIAALLKEQSEHFDKSIKQVYKKVDEVENFVRLEFAEIRAEMGKFKSDIESWMDVAGKAFDHTNKGVGHVLENLHQVSEDVVHLNAEQSNLIAAHDQGLNFLDDQIERQLQKLFNLLHDDVIKGEESSVAKISECLAKIEESASKVSDLDGNIYSKMSELQDYVKQSVKDVQSYTQDTSHWLLHEIGSLLGFNIVVQKPEAAVAGPRLPGSSPKSSIPIDEDVESEIPAETYQDYWDDPVFAEKSEEVQFSEPPEKSSKRKLFAERVAPKKPNPNKKAREFYDKPPPRNFHESWSPVSRDIIITTFDLVTKHDGKVSDFYSQDEWGKFKRRTAERSYHFKTGGTKETAPDKYWPKPRAFFNRIEAVRQMQADAIERVMSKQKGKEKANP